jgi:glycosyltransferase involved in cell wall biosynthesis
MTSSFQNSNYLPDDIRMKIALISYGYPPDTPYGGIATYVYQVARMLNKRNHHVEVFTSSPYRYGTSIEDGIVVHRIVHSSQDYWSNQQDFVNYVGEAFAERHKDIQFDVIEGPDYLADAREAVRLVPDIPLVIKLHSPLFLVNEVNNSLNPRFLRIPALINIRIFLGSLRRGIKPKWYRSYNCENDIERIHALEADEIATPSLALGNKLVAEWGLDADKVAWVPYPYIPTDAFLNIPATTYTNTVTFIGRLEIRKGVLDLAKAIPKVLKQRPDVKFRFAGTSTNSPDKKLNMQQYLEKNLRHYKNSIEFTGSYSADDLSSILASTDICVFPSIWENFPLVCLEAMAAARGIIGSSSGGIPEMLNDGKAGLTIPPRNSAEIADAILDLLERPEFRIQLGQLARERVLTEYNIERIGALQEASYYRAITRRQAMGVRHLN